MDGRTEVELFEQKGSFSQICRYGFRRTSPWFRRAALRLKDLQLSPPRAKESSSADLWECVTLRNRMDEEGKGADKGRSMLKHSNARLRCLEHKPRFSKPLDRNSFPLLAAAQIPSNDAGGRVRS